MMAAGMMGILSLGMMKMMETQRKSAKSVKTSAEIQSFYMEAKGYLAKSGYCKKTFEDMTIKEDEEFELEDVLKPNGKVLYKVGELYGDRTFRLTSIQVSGFEKDSESSGIMKLHFYMKKIGKSYGAKEYMRYIKIDVQVGTKGEILDCGTLGSMLGGTALDGTQGVENMEVAIKDLQDGKVTEETKKLEKVIYNNKQLKSISDSIDSMKKTNEQMKALFAE
ncbi:hypothetical protein A9Q84_07225 [Halobacteriovorax marinus]|uniref:Uncharacterized protein n=1 Tax=Halobacteriovorax marinus TaxID=97084 RepID=A0A1Y5F5Z6_9BACT|nr:hypothetical protein A9Q84_07225 [Halobacteriovorax marinus]